MCIAWAVSISTLACPGRVTEDVRGVLAAVTDTRSMAGEMSLSEHTIQDHLTSIFAKTGSHDYVTVLSRAPGTRLEN
jgi:DNA-binding NarL/FixJ family response regulator